MTEEILGGKIFSLARHDWLPFLRILGRYVNYTATMLEASTNNVDRYSNA